MNIRNRRSKQGRANCHESNDIENLCNSFDGLAASASLSLVLSNIDAGWDTALDMDTAQTKRNQRFNRVIEPTRRNINQTTLAMAALRSYLHSDRSRSEDLCPTVSSYIKLGAPVVFGLPDSSPLTLNNLCCQFCVSCHNNTAIRLVRLHQRRVWGTVPVYPHESIV